MRASIVPSLERMKQPPRVMPARARSAISASGGSIAHSVGSASRTSGSSSGATSIETRVARAKSATACSTCRATAAGSWRTCSRTIDSAIAIAMPASSRSAERMTSSRICDQRMNSEPNDSSTALITTS